jgi:hypothetical protein
VAGLLLLSGTMPLLWAIVGAKNDFRIIAASAVAPKPESTQEMAQAAALPITVGCAIWLLSGFVLLAGGQVGIRTKPSPTIGTRSILGVFAAIASVVLGAAAFLLFVGVWLHGGALEAVLGSSALTPKPSELARHLAGVLNKSLLAFIIVGCLGIMQAVAAIFAPSSGSEAVFESMM